MQSCAYMVWWVPEGCTEFSPGQIYYTDCPDDGQCTAMIIIEDGPCEGAMLFAMSCACE